MSANLYLPPKAAYQTSYTIATPGSYTWVAPNALNTGASYAINLSMWGGGGAGGNSGSANGQPAFGGGGGGGAWCNTQCTVVPGVSYTLVVGASAGASYIQDSLGQIIKANQGGSGTVITGGAGGTVTTNQPSKVTGTNSINGGAGGNGSWWTGSAIVVATAGVSVGAAYGQPGGLAGTGTNGSSGPGGASSNANGANTIYSAGGAGGGGGAGYSNGTSNSVTTGGAGGVGRIQFSFTVANGGSAGSAPV